MNSTNISKYLKYEELGEYFNFIEKCKKDKNYYDIFEKKHSDLLFQYLLLLYNSKYSFKFQFKNCVKIFKIIDGNCKSILDKKAKKNKIIPGSIYISIRVYSENLVEQTINLHNIHISFKNFNKYFINFNFDFDIIEDNLINTYK